MMSNLALSRQVSWKFIAILMLHDNILFPIFMLYDFVLVLFLLLPLFFLLCMNQRALTGWHLHR